MTAEDNFLRKFGAFVNDSDIFTETMQKRIRLYLSEYKEELPEKIVLVDKPVAHLAYIPTKRLLGTKKKLPKVTEDLLKYHAVELCAQYKVKYNLFRKPPKGKSTWQITAIRKEFCFYIMENYECTQQILKDFFGLNHTTITYYLRGKKIAS
jgi:hypothetical protein